MHGVVAAAVKMKVDTTKCKDAKSMGQAYLQDPKKAVHQSEFEKLPQWATKVNLKQNKYVCSHCNLQFQVLNRKKYHQRDLVLYLLHNC